VAERAKTAQNPWPRFPLWRPVLRLVARFPLPPHHRLLRPAWYCAPHAWAITASYQGTFLSPRRLPRHRRGCQRSAPHLAAGSWHSSTPPPQPRQLPAASRFRFSTPYIPKVPFPFQREGARDGGRVVWPVDLCGTGPPGQVYRPDCTTTQARSFSDTPPPLDCSCRALHTTASEVAHGANQIP
jgi:hypothetical protein